MPTALDEYLNALERLKNNKPINVARGSRISNDTVALEAGRGRGSIKKSRAIFLDLIQAINEAASEQKATLDTDTQKLDKAKISAKNYRSRYEESLARELSMLHEIESLKQEIKTLMRSNVKRIK